MAISQIVWSLDEKKPLQMDSLTNEKELEDLLCEHIEILNKNWLVIGRQVKTSAGKWMIARSELLHICGISTKLNKYTLYLVFQHNGKRLISHVWF